MPTPTCSAASMMRAPFGTAVTMPLIVTCTVSLDSFAISLPSDRGRHGRAPTDQCQVLILELRQRADHRGGRRIAEHADRRPRHVPAQVDEHVQVLFRALPCFDAPQNPGEPVRPLATGCALTAGLVG